LLLPGFALPVRLGLASVLTSVLACSPVAWAGAGAAVLASGVPQPGSISPTAPAHPAYPEGPYQSALLKPGKTLSLKEAVLLAVRNNASLKTAYLERVLDRFRLEYARTEFQPQGSLKLASSTRRDSGGQSENPGSDQGTNQGAGQSIKQTSTRHDAALDLSMALPTGGRINFAWEAVRDAASGNAVSNSGAAQSANTRNLTLQWTQPLLRGAGSEIGLLNLRQAEIAENQARLQLRASVSATISNVINAYRTLIDARAQIGLAQEALQRSRTLEGINQTLVDTGRLGKIELLQTRADIAAGELDVIQAETNADNARLALLKLLDMDLLSDIIPLEAATPAPLRLPDESEALALAQRQRPDFLALQQGLRAAEIGLQKAKNQRLWQLDLVLGTTRNQQSGADPATARRSNSAALQLTIPINDRSSQLALSAAQIDSKKVALQLGEMQQALRVEVMNALRNVHNTRRQVALAEQNLNLNRQKLEAELIKLEVGRSSLFQVTSFQQNLKQAEQTRINANTAWANALTQLDLTLGTTLQTWEILLD
jgi:outer membrane protein TolC